MNLQASAGERAGNNRSVEAASRRLPSDRIDRHLRHAGRLDRRAGGGSDGNFTGANGIPTLDGLGPLGQGYHTLDEHVLIDTLPQRAQLFAALLADLDVAGGVS